MTSTVETKDAGFNDQHPQDYIEYICHDSNCDNIEMPSSVTVSDCEVLLTKESVRDGKSSGIILRIKIPNFRYK